jgi:hypothetical protein
MRLARMDCRVNPGNDENNGWFSRRPSARVLPTPPRTKIDSPPPNRMEAKRRKAHANHCRRAKKWAQCLPHSSAFGAAARHADKCTQSAHSSACGARPPSGATPRLSPGRTHPPLAQLQFPRFLRPDLAGVTRFDLSRVYRAPRRPVVLPVERWPKAARERNASFRARAPHSLRI